MRYEASFFTSSNISLRLSGICIHSCFSIRLVGNLVGLDEIVTVDGNDAIQKTNFSLSPHVAKSSSAKRGKSQSKLTAPSAGSTAYRKRVLSDTHRDSVSAVSDLRLHKRGKTQTEQEEEDDCIIVDPDAVEFEPTTSSKPSSRVSGSKKTVTPSPHPSSRPKQSSSNNLTPVRLSKDSSSFARSDKSNRSRPNDTGSNWSNRTATNTNRKGPRNARSSSWFSEKRQQKNSQQTAFHSPKGMHELVPLMCLTLEQRPHDLPFIASRHPSPIRKPVRILPVRSK